MTISCASCGHVNAANVKFCGECGTRLATATVHEAGAAGISESLPFAVGTTIAQGRYHLDAVLGQGGMGTVYRATDVSLSRVCALKVLNAELTAHPTARKRMEREARALARIEHPNVVQIRSVFVEGDLLAMELEYMSGGDLRGLIERGGLTPDRVASLMISILSGLQALHDAKLVHRDIKPENVLLDSRGEPKLTDLGVARDDAESGRTRTRLGAVLGTLEYMSPEQIQGLAVDARSDIYACGVMLVQMLTGELPFAAKSEFEWQLAHVQQEPDLGRARAVHAGLAEVVARALAKAPAERWQDAASMAQSLHTRSNGAMTNARAPSEVMHGVGNANPPKVLAAQDSAARSPKSAAGGGKGRFIGTAVGAILLLGGGVAAIQLRASPEAPKQPLVSTAEAIHRAVEPAPAGPVRVELQSLPTGASVHVDGKEIGKTPLPIEVKPGERVRALLTHAGYRDFEALIEAEQAPSRTVELTEDDEPNPRPGVKQRNKNKANSAMAKAQEDSRSSKRVVAGALAGRNRATTLFGEAGEGEKGSVMAKTFGGSNSSGRTVAGALMGGGGKATKLFGEASEGKEGSVVAKTFGGSDSSNDATAEAVAKAVARKNSAVRRCYETALRSNPGLSGRVTVKYTVGTAGTVTNSSVSGANGEFATCIKTKFSRIRGLPLLPAPRGFTQSYEFSETRETTKSQLERRL